ncbi:MAG TPA: hypothetical protein VGP46_09920 [Acidimicrobiales bacterium]|nr:hypothetical protein [Acidimicrobiales bacterium]
MRRAIRFGVVALSSAGLAWLTSACSVSGTTSAITAPLAVLPATDVVVEQNLATVVQAHGTTGVSGLGGVTGIGVVTGPSLNYDEVSEGGGTGVTVFASYNQLDGHCLGVLELSSTGVSVLGQSAPGTYDFWQVKGGSSLCDASSFAAYAGIPKDWPAGDPALSWPGGSS